MRINWGKGLVLFFIIFFIWVFSFLFFALRQNNDLVSEDYYQRGASYSEDISINARSAAFADSITIGRSDNRIIIRLTEGVLAGNDSVQAYFFRSSDKTKDLHFVFSKKDNPFQIDKSLFSHGRYQLFVSWNHLGKAYRVKKSVDVE